MVEERWHNIHALLREFESYLSPKCPPLKVIAATDRQWSDDEYAALRPAGFPSRLRGVYLLFDADGSLLYVGLAMYNYDKRVWSHDSYIDRRWIDIIPFEDTNAFLAPALEFFLISRLKPRHNTVYRDY